MKTTVRPVETSVHETLSARSIPRRRHRATRAPADFALHELRHRTHVEETAAVAAAEERGAAA